MSANLVNLNWSITQGTDYSLELPFQDSTYLNLDPSLYTFKLEIFSISELEDSKLVFASTSGFSGVPGTITKIFSKTDLAGLDHGLYKYRVIAVNTSTTTTGIIAKGFVTVEVPAFDLSQAAYQPTVALSDGTLYANEALFINLNVWYVASNVMIFNVYGLATLSIELKMASGSLISPFAIFVTPDSTMSTWAIPKDGVYAFRVNRVAGDLTSRVQYLPKR